MTALVETLLPEPVVHAPDDHTWRTLGACTAPASCVATRERIDFWSLDPAVIAAAKQMCDVCPVQIECLDHALANGESSGVWGTTDEVERRRVARSVHGTPERYSARRCRCEPCTLAHLRVKALQRNVEALLAEALCHADVVQ